MTNEEFNIESLPINISYVAEVPSKWDDKKTNVDQWRIVIETKAGYWSTDYFTGLGLRTPIPAMKNPPRKGTIAYQQLEKQYRKPKKPKIADVLYSLFTDAAAANDNFHDWCDNFGYSDDSIHALNTYKQCLEIATALRKHFTQEQRTSIESIISEM
jgi:hypothetical protein